MSGETGSTRSLWGPARRPGEDPAPESPSGPAASPIPDPGPDVTEPVYEGPAPAPVTPPAGHDGPPPPVPAYDPPPPLGPGPAYGPPPPAAPPSSAPGPAYGPPGPVPPAAPGRRPAVLVGAVFLAVAVVGAASLTIANLTASAGPRPTAPEPVPTMTATTYPSPVAAPSTTADPPPTTATGDGLVTLEAAAAQNPGAPAVQALVERYFTAINGRDYDSWSTTVVPRRAQQQPRSGWMTAYRSTVDSDVDISTIASTGPDSVAIGISFVSTQDVADAPPTLQAPRICWESTWPVVGLAQGGRIDAPPRGSTSSRAC